MPVTLERARRKWKRRMRVVGVWVVGILDCLCSCVCGCVDGMTAYERSVLETEHPGSR